MLDDAGERVEKRRRGDMEAGFVDGFRFRNHDIWNLPIASFDDRWDLFNHILRRFMDDSGVEYSSQNKCRFLELGVWTAGTVSRVVKEFGKIFDYTGVDPYGMLVDDPYKGMFWKTSDEAELVYSSALQIFHDNEATLVRRSSADFFASDRREFDIVFVDGDHRYAGALHDCETGLERLRPGGLLIVDDIGNSFHPEVEWAVREFSNRHASSISRRGAQPLFFQLEGMPIPVVLIFAYFQKR